MKTKLLPWLLVVALAVGMWFLYASDQKHAADIAQLQQANAELEQFRAASATNQADQAANSELVKLREENKDLLRLRNEVRRLREENQQATKQAQTAQAQVQTVQAQAEAFRASAAQASAQAQQAEAAARVQNQASACVNNLRQIDGAIQQWALENSRPAGSPVTMADILPYFKNRIPPACPAGGVYSVSTVGASPTCSIPGHVLPK